MSLLQNALEISQRLSDLATAALPTSPMTRKALAPIYQSMEHSLAKLQDVSTMDNLHPQISSPGRPGIDDKAPSPTDKSPHQNFALSRSPSPFFPGNQLALRKRSLTPPSPTPERPLKKKASRCSTRSENIDKRLNAILAHVCSADLGRLSIHFVAPIIFNSARYRTDEEREQRALMDLCKGYEPGTRDAICDLFKSATRPFTHTFEKTYKTFQTLYNEKDTTKRLIGQDEHLFGFIDGEPLTAMVYYVIHTMAAIRWAIDFAKQPKDYKTLYVNDLCKTVHKAELDATDKEGRQEIHRTFSASHRKHVNFRNNLVRLYRLFGVAIFLDPRWGARKKTGRPAYSDTLGSLISSLIKNERIKTIALDIQRRQDNRTLFINVMEVIGTAWVGRYVNDFLKNVPENSADLTLLG